MTDPILDTPLATRKSRPGLGRGLSALMGDIAREEPLAPGATHAPGLRILPVGSMTPHPGQPRRRFDEAALDELAASIAMRIASAVVRTPKALRTADLCIFTVRSLKPSS